MAALTRRGVSLAASLVLAGGMLAACAGNGTALARQACGSVDRAVADYRAADGQVGEAAAQLRARANRHLMDAQALAAQATSADGTWNAMMTILQERNKIGAQRVLPLLISTCKMARSSTPYIIAPSGGPKGSTP